MRRSMVGHMLTYLQAQAVCGCGCGCVCWCVHACVFHPSVSWKSFPTVCRLLIYGPAGGACHDLLTCKAWLIIFSLLWLTARPSDMWKRLCVCVCEWESFMCLACVCICMCSTCGVCVCLFEERDGWNVHVSSVSAAGGLSWFIPGMSLCICVCVCLRRQVPDADPTVSPSNTHTHTRAISAVSLAIPHIPEPQQHYLITGAAAGRKRSIRLSFPLFLFLSRPLFVMFSFTLLLLLRLVTLEEPEGVEVLL